MDKWAGKKSEKTRLLNQKNIFSLEQNRNSQTKEFLYISKIQETDSILTVFSLFIMHL